MTCYVLKCGSLFFFFMMHESINFLVDKAAGPCREMINVAPDFHINTTKTPHMGSSNCESTQVFFLAFGNSLHSTSHYVHVSSIMQISYSLQIKTRLLIQKTGLWLVSVALSTTSCQVFSFDLKPSNRIRPGQQDILLEFSRPLGAVACCTGITLHASLSSQKKRRTCNVSASE